jgi:hypothetical protein
MRTIAEAAATAHSANPGGTTTTTHIDEEQ